MAGAGHFVANRAGCTAGCQVPPTGKAALRRFTRVRFQQDAKPLAANDLGCGGHVVVGRAASNEQGIVDADPLVWSLSVKVLDVLFDEEIQVRFAEHDKVIEALVLDRLDPAFDVCVQVRRKWPRAADFDALCAKHFVERA